LLQLLYSQFVRSRRRYYQRRPEIRRRLTSPVISVGNLTMGGSGKTPLAAEIARMLVEMGERPSILSRGYARQNPSDGVVLVGDGKHIFADAAHAGDEPYMLARDVPGAAVVVCPSRYLAGRVAESQLRCTVHVLRRPTISSMSGRCHSEDSASRWTRRSLPMRCWCRWASL